MAKIAVPKQGGWPGGVTVATIVLVLALPVVVYFLGGAGRAAQLATRLVADTAAPGADSGLECQCPPAVPLAAGNESTAGAAGAGAGAGAAEVEAAAAAAAAAAEAEAAASAVEAEAAAEAAAAAAAADTASRQAVRLPSWRDSPHAAPTNFTPSLTPREAEKGIVSFGERSRARRAVAKLLRGEAINVAFFGGSITQGTGAADPGNTAYVPRVLTWINSTFPRKGDQKAHDLRNSGHGAVPSSYFSLCCAKEAPLDVDIVVLEFNINDGGGPNTPLRRAHERLVRKLLNFPNRPAVLEFAFWGYPVPNVDEHSSGMPFRSQGDDEIGSFAQYYKLPWLSWRSLIWDAWNETQAVPPEQRTPAKFDHSYLFTLGQLDALHPNEAGHTWISELIIHWLGRMLDDVVRHPLEAEDEEEAQRPLPLPMYKDNWELPGNSTCLVGEEIKDYVTAHDPAFEWLDEGKAGMPKWGFISRQPGSWLTLTLNTTLRGVRAEDKITLGIVHLISYEHMGTASVECVEGCVCEPAALDGHHDLQFSVLNFASLAVSPSEACQIKITVLNGTRSGEHKVKVIGAVLSGDKSGFLIGGGNQQGMHTLTHIWRD